MSTRTSSNAYFVGCSSGQNLEKLYAIESYIQERPDSARVSLDNIDQVSLTGQKEKALFSLLYSMALDKNYIDVKSDSLIRPAVEYYSTHGKRYYKFLTYYYLGRVYENARLYSEALDSYLKAETCIDKTISAEYKSRLYSSKSRVYFHQFALDRMLDETLKSKAVAAYIENPGFYLRNSLDAVSLYVTKNELQKSYDELDSLNKWISAKNIEIPVEYYESRLRIALADSTETPHTIEEHVNEYIKQCDSFHTPRNYLLIAKAMSAAGRLKEAETALDYCDRNTYVSDFEKIEFYSELSSINQAKGDYKQALEAEQEYQRAVERVNLTVFNNDVRFLEERYTNLMQNEKRRREHTLLYILVTMLLVGCIALVVILSRRNGEYKKMLSDAGMEYSFISDMLRQGVEGESGSILDSRLNALRPYLYHDKFYPSIFTSRDDFKRMDEGRKEMLRSIGMVYALSFPEFVTKLLTYNLSAEEVGLCALYVAGYSSKEMNGYLKTGSIVHINWSIRKKLGSSIDSRKLHTWLKQVFNDTVLHRS